MKRAQKKQSGRVARIHEPAPVAAPAFRGIEDVPLENLVPAPGYIVARVHTASESRGGIILPGADVSALVCERVGPGVEHIQVGDLVLLEAKSTTQRVPEVDKRTVLVLASVVIGVIRGHNWAGAETH